MAKRNEELHAKILERLTKHPELSNVSIAKELGCNEKTVRLKRKELQGEKSEKGSSGVKVTQKTQKSVTKNAKVTAAVSETDTAGAGSGAKVAKTQKKNNEQGAAVDKQEAIKALVTQEKTEDDKDKRDLIGSLIVAAIILIIGFTIWWVQR